MVKQKSEWTKYLVSSCISASFMFGYGIGAPNQYSKFTEPFLDKKFELCDVNEETFRIENKCPNVASVSFNESATKSDGTKDNSDLDKLEQKKFDRQVFVQELINGISQTLFVVGNLIGAITGPYWLKCSRFFDRRRIFYANYPFTYLFAILIIVSYYKRCVSLFYISRFVHGIQAPHKYKIAAIISIIMLLTIKKLEKIHWINKHKIGSRKEMAKPWTVPEKSRSKGKRCRTTKTI
ncbi:hypothetical protein ACOME3_010733 [Neoechinorhynchus agilis]